MRLHIRGILASYNTGDTYRIRVGAYIVVSVLETIGAAAHVATNMWYGSECRQGI